LGKLVQLERFHETIRSVLFRLGWAHRGELTLV